jgi:acetyl-CoA C-acetyltransferase
MERKVVIIDALRTPFDNFGGPMKYLTPVEMSAHVTKKLLERTKIDPNDVTEFHLGVNLPAANKSVARQAALKSGLSEQVNCTTVDRACCSAMAAIATGYNAIRLGEADIAIGGGSENMGNTPYFLEGMRFGTRMGDVNLKDLLIVKCPYTEESRAVQAGEVAVEFDISREMQDKWALRSQQLYQEANKAGKFDDEIVPIEVKERKGTKLIESDLPPRASTTLEKLANLKTIYGNPTVTAGNAPGLNTGATSVLIMGEDEAQKRNIKPLATIISHAQASGHPKYIASIPAEAAKKALDKAGMTIDQMDVIEINEAFAVMPLVSTKILGESDPERVEALRAKTNVNGGAIAIGHPSGATGARLLMTLAYELKRRGGGIGLCTICGGIGEGECYIIEV